MRLASIVSVLIVLLLGGGSHIPAIGAPVHFTAITHAAKLTYFAVVDESRVAQIHASLQGSSADTHTSGGMTATTFDAQHQRYDSGVQRPDMGLGAGPDVILQSINSQIAAYTPSGRLVHGWPKLASLFFGLPSTQFMVDPRLVYDTWDRRFWAAYLSGPTYLLAVSQTADPNGKWNVYGFAVSDAQGVGPDFTQLAIDEHRVSISSHLLNTVHLNDFHAGIYTLDKSALESGSTHVKAHGFTDIAVDGTDLDTVEPVLVPDPLGVRPRGEFFLSTDGFNFPCYGGRGTCTSLYLLMISTTRGVQSLDGVVITVPKYGFTPAADTPACHQCLETVGPMMTTSPVYRNGLISFAYGTGVGSGRNRVAGIEWGQLAPTIVGTRLKSASLLQGGLFRFPGDEAAIFPAVMTDQAGNFLMVLDGSSSTLSPSVYVAARRKGDPPNRLIATLLLKRGLSPPPVFAWGDFTAASFNGATGVWFASEYAAARIGQPQYGTIITNVHL